MTENTLIIHFELGDENPLFNLTHKLTLNPEMDERLQEFYQEYFSGLVELAVQPDQIVEGVRSVKRRETFYKQVALENATPKKTADVVNLFPPVKLISAKG